ncbi:hypothetical protein A5699_03400 [Mycobacterium sp. E802]|uniref:endonuclease domain-containing protein n=1 Tax=Mycobacterium sp. E802 TaxID=1834152 RepID=UPI0007FC798A|nr:DUF559 domain-containing protein [Mycobacterium sp. E802]OBG83795.1 hypothetical protein A5699_03400 [Mycobacterium sp. E802]
MSATAVTRATRALLTQHNLPTGTSLEDRVTWRLHRWGCLGRTQHPVGPYRLDYAWPAVRIAVEVDGPHRWQPDIGIKDVARDAYLRSHGSLVLRIDDGTGSIEEQLCRVVVVIKSELNRGAA